MSNVYRLAPPRKKGLLHLVFSRFALIALLILLQLAMYVAFYGWLSTWLPFFSAFLVAFTVIMIIYLFNSGMDFSAKLTWMLVIAVLQVPGALFLLFTQMNVGYRKIARRENTLVRQTHGAITQSPEVLDALEREDAGTAALVKYLNRSGCFPVYADTDVTYFPSGEEKFAAMLEALASAEKFIFMEYFIIEEGYMWGKILELLVAKAAQGVDVKLILPGIPDKKAAYALAKAHYKRLVASGVKVYEYTPGFIHAKVFVSDNCKAVVGTINLDYRSLYHHFECATYLYKTACIPQIESDFQQTLSQCREVTLRTIKNEKLSYKLMGTVMQFIAPLM